MTSTRISELISRPYTLALAVEILAEIRTAGHRDSQLVVDFGKKLVFEFFSSLGEDRWVILEQVCIAALDCSEFKLSAECISKLSHQFPESIRVKRLIGMQHEAKGECHKALILYNKILAIEPADVLTMKRKISIHVETGQPKKAISLLNEYLTVFMSDSDAWAELAILYLEEQMYPQAAFCVEELILCEPHNYHYYVKLAEIKFTQGGVDNLLESLHYFSFSLELSKEANLRGFYGLCLATSALYTLHKSNVTPEAVSAYKQAKEEILKQTSPEHLEIVTNTFSSNLDFFKL